MAIAKLSENKKILVKCESAFFVNKFRNRTFLSISILQGSYSSAVKAGLLIFFFFKVSWVGAEAKEKNCGSVNGAHFDEGISESQ